MLPTLPDDSVRLFILDPPYGITANTWDTALTDAEWVLLFQHMWRAGVPNVAILIFGVPPMSAKLIAQFAKWYKYPLYWDKRLPVCHFHAKRQPLRRIEELMMFYRKPPRYNPQKTVDPRGNRSWSRAPVRAACYRQDKGNAYASKGLKYPTNLLSFYLAPKDKTHPTQKPQALMEWLIASYSDAGDCVVDPFAGSGAVAKAALALGRSCVSCETDAKCAKQLRSIA